MFRHRQRAAVLRRRKTRRAPSAVSTNTRTKACTDRGKSSAAAWHIGDAGDDRSRSRSSLVECDLMVDDAVSVAREIPHAG